MAHALEEISQDFAKKIRPHDRLHRRHDGRAQERVRNGEKADVIEVTSVGMDALEKEKLVFPARDRTRPRKYRRRRSRGRSAIDISHRTR